MLRKDCKCVKRVCMWKRVDTHFNSLLQDNCLVFLNALNMFSVISKRVLVKLPVLLVHLSQAPVRFSNILSTSYMMFLSLAHSLKKDNLYLTK